MATAYLGALVNRLLNQRMLLAAFAVIMIVAGVRMFLPTKSVDGPCALPGGGTNWRSCLPRTLSTGAVVGFLTGLLGVGGGFLIVPALTLVLGLPMSVTVGTSLVVIVINSIAGFTAHLGACRSIGVSRAPSAPLQWPHPSWRLASADDSRMSSSSVDLPFWCCSSPSTSRHAPSRLEPREAT